MEKILDKLKEAMGGFCVDISLMQYGVTNEEMIWNLNKLLTKAQNLVDGDEIYFDITHSFRSLPIYELLVINLSKATMGKNIRIAAVSYGMFEASSVFNKRAPIVDLSLLVNMMDWMKAVEEYNRYGTAHLLVDLLESNSFGLPLSHTLKTKVTHALKQLGEVITANEWQNFKTLISECRNITNNEDFNHNAARYVVGGIFEDFSKTYGDIIHNDVLLYTEFAKQHFQKKRYMTCAVMLEECMLNFFASLVEINRSSNKWKWTQEERFRDKLANVTSNNASVKELFVCYKRIHSIRNHIAHGNALSDKVRSLPDTRDKKVIIKDELEFYIDQIKEKLENDFNTRNKNRDALRSAINNAP
jgi:CRISPR-associated DxTHG motif protein